MSNLSIAHWSDLHIRLASRHDEYRIVLDRFIEQLKEEEPDLIIFTGDLAHNKVHLSPEVYDMATYAFDNLVEIAPNIIIKGNHDENQGNSNRLDAISPFVRLFNSNRSVYEKLIYLKDSGVYDISHNDDLQFFVYPMDQKNIPDESKIDPDKINIALFHGVVRKARTNKGFQFEEEDEKIHIPYEKFDSVMLGDIHKVQKLKDNMAYAGSLIQQDWGEHPTDHGYLLWKFEDKKLDSVQFKKVQNDYGYYLVKHKDGEFDTPYEEFPPNSTVKIVYETDDIQSDVKEKFSNKFSSVKNILFEEEGVNVEGNIINVKNDIINLHDFKNQEETVKDYFEDDEDLEEILEINEKLFEENKSSFDQEITRTTFDLGYIEYDNIFNYGEDNKFIFSDKHGVVGFFSPNRSGKSAFLDTISFAIFGETPHTSTYDDIINFNKDSYYTYITVNTPNKNFSIERSGKKSNSGWRNSLTITEYDSNGEVIEEESDMREAKDKIEKYFGDAKTYKKTAYIYQDNTERFLDLTPARRQEWLYNNLGLDVFEILHEASKKKSKDTKNRLEYLKSRDIKQKLNEKRVAKGELSEDEEKIEKEIDKIEKQIRKHDEKIEDLRNKKRPIDHSLEDQSDDIERARDTIKSQREEIKKLRDFDIEDVEVPDSYITRLEGEKNTLKSLENDDGKLEEEKKKQNKLKEVLQEGKETKSEIDEYEDTLEKLSDDIELIEVENIDQKIEDLEEYTKREWEIDSEIDRIEETIETFEDKSSVLKKDERFENEELCQTCPLLEEARKKKDQLPEYKEELKQLKEEKENISEKKEKLQTLQNTKEELNGLKDEYSSTESQLEIYKNKRESLMDQYKSLQEDIKSLEKRRNEIKEEKIQNAKNRVEKAKKLIEDHKNEKVTEVKEKANEKEHKVEKLESNVESLLDQQDKYEKQLKDIKKNKKIEEKIEEHKKNKSDYQSRKQSQDDKLIEIKSKIKSVDDKIQDLKNEYEELKNLKDEYKVYSKYIDATHKNQIPLQVITSMLDVIQSELNNVVSQITDFRLRLFVEDENVECNIIDTKGERSATRLSGMERFICNLAFRIAIAQIGNMAVPNFLIVDESFSAVDSSNSQEFPNLFAYLKNKFNFILVVSHDERMRDMVDYNIEINSEEKFAKLYE